MSRRSIVAVELCLRHDPHVHATLRALLEQNRRALGYQDKWNLYGQASATLLAAQAHWHRGCWDFFDDDARARGDFNMWVSGMLTEEGARATPSATGDPYRTGGRGFLTFTMAALMVQGAPSERRLMKACNIPESRLWHASTFQHVLASLRYLNFASVEASTMYLIPRDPTYVLTDEDLRHPKFEYLRPIV